jgi:hypothetical protein
MQPHSWEGFLASTAAATTVLSASCRSWYQLATCDDCWALHLGGIFPLTFKRNPAAQRWFHQQRQPQQQQQQLVQLQPQQQQDIKPCSAGSGRSSFPSEASAEATHGAGGGAVVGPGPVYARFCSKARSESSQHTRQKVWCVHALWRALRAALSNSQQVLSHGS